MFQIEPILWLREFASPGMDWLMTSVSRLGYSEVYGSIMVCLIFGYRMKISLAVLVAAFLVGLLNHSLKKSLQFPRPSDIDVRVLPEGYKPPLELTKIGSGKNFWSLPSSEARHLASLQTNWSYGLPSGHVSAATVFLLSIAFFFRSKKVLWFAALWIPLMCVSRMYLGRHFLGDVLGGILVGMFGLFLAYQMLRNLYFQSASPQLRILIPMACLVIPMFLAAPFVSFIHNENAGRMLAILLMYVFLVKEGFPSDAGNIWQRVARVFIVSLTYVFIDQLLSGILEPKGWDELPIMEVMGTCLTYVIGFIGGIVISKKTGLYQA